jgi:solute carrier family 45, member 1/2/4
MVGGTAGAVLSILLFAWIRDIVQILGTVVGLQATSLRMTMTLMAFALVLALNVAVQSIQLGARSLIVENVPHHQQMIASAWASYQIGMGNIVGYVCGSIRLPDFFILPGLTQFQYLSSIACSALIVTVLISCYFIVEDDPKSSSLPKGHTSPFAIFKRLSHAYINMPIRVWKVCQVQFCSWMGWFTFLFYGAK